MDNLISVIERYFADDKLSEKKTLFFGVLIIIGFIVIVDNLVIDFAKFIGFQIRPFLYPLLLCLWACYWCFCKYRLPRNKKKKVGIVIAIYAENEMERKKLKADFIAKLKADFRQEGGLNFLELIFLKNHLAYDIKESSDLKSKIGKINKKIKAHFYVCGDIKKRSNGNAGETYFIKFYGYVVHKPIPLDLSNKLSINFSKVLPGEVNFLEKQSLEGFEASAKVVHLAAKYIIGIAAFVSYDPVLALKLHNDLKDQFDTLKPLQRDLQDIRNRIALLVSDEMLWISKWHFKENRITEAKIFLQGSLTENPNNYGAWLFMGGLDFLVDKNPDNALKCIRKARKYAKNTFEWRYSEAFLFFWRGDYLNALNVCQAIKRHTYTQESLTLAEVRKFNLDLLKEENPKAQLFFWIGYLAYFKDKNFANALQDLEMFENLADSTMDSLKRKSSAYLIDIKRLMKIEN